jgi:membrane-associated protease RseP (regulator of RpoE activity)
VLAAFGDPLHSEASLTVGYTTKCIPQPDQGCTAADPKAPAYGVLHAGDRITSVDGNAITEYPQLVEQLQSHPGEPVTLTVIRDGRARQVTLTPVGVRQDGRTVGKVGLGPVINQVDVSVAAAVPRTFTTMGSLFTSTVKALGDLPHQVSTILHDQPRENGAASVVGIGRVSGQVADADVSLGIRIANLAFIIAQVNFFVGIFNMLPLLPLDGGHIAIVGYEEGRRKVYGWLGRPDPGRVDLLKIMPVTYAVVALFIGLSALLIYADIANPIKLQ